MYVRVGALQDSIVVVIQYQNRTTLLRELCLEIQIRNEEYRRWTKLTEIDIGICKLKGTGHESCGTGRPFVVVFFVKSSVHQWTSSR